MKYNLPLPFKSLLVQKTKTQLQQVFVLRKECRKEAQSFHFSELCLSSEAAGGSGAAERDTIPLRI